MEYEKKVKSLRTFFRISNIAFDTVMAMGTVFGGKPVVSSMHQLQRQALEEIEKGNPDLEVIDSLLAEMEELAKANKVPTMDFPKGCASIPETGEEIVFNPNPFLTQADFFELPKQVLNGHWVTREFGFQVFNSGNPLDRWVYIVVGDKLLKATPEFLNDSIAARLAFSKMKG